MPMKSNGYSYHYDPWSCSIDFSKQMNERTNVEYIIHIVVNAMAAINQ